MKKQVRTILCGCGNCQLRKNLDTPCSMASSKTAIWLWSSSTEDVEEIADSVVEVGQELQELSDEVDAENLEVAF